MVWTAPTDRTTGDVVTAADWNGVEDDLTYLYARPQFRVHMAVAAPMASSTATVLFDTVVEDPNAGWSSSNHWYTIPTGETGRWLFVTCLSWATNSTGARRAIINVNGSLYQGPAVPAATDPAGYSWVSTLVEATAGQTVYVQGFQNSGGSLNTLTGANNVFFSGIRTG